MLFALTLGLALTFTSADGSSIAGTLSFPTTLAAKVPAIVLVGSNGPADRLQSVGATKVFDLYATALNKAGFAVLRYDNRGVGESTTKTRPSAVRRQNFIDDAMAAITATAADSRVDPNRIFGLGMSEGAETLLAAALEGARLRGLVLVGPLSLPYAQALAEQDLSAGSEVQERDRLLLALPYFQSYQGIDPRQEIGSVQQPILAVRGLYDQQTPAADFDGLVNAAQTAHRTITAERFARDDHFLLRLPPDELQSGPQYAQAHRLDPGAIAFIVSWLRSH
ncbi:MAG TPA: alpha/beta fold hydrolase [Candidatus Rubrimentiphilum sp.]|nr:alpha/beta fold hydrolase [Candidatus Rubrimentiphilum sp.]